MTVEASRPIAVLILDSVTAPETARRAAALAAAENRPLILLVPVRGTGFTLNALTRRAGHLRETADAQAISARVRPVLDRSGIAYSVRRVPYRAAVYSFGVITTRKVKAEAKRVRAVALVTPHTTPVPGTSWTT